MWWFSVTRGDDNGCDDDSNCNDGGAGNGEVMMEMVVSEGVEIMAKEEAEGGGKLVTGGNKEKRKGREEAWSEWEKPKGRKKVGQHRNTKEEQTLTALVGLMRLPV